MPAPRRRGGKKGAKAATAVATKRKPAGRRAAATSDEDDEDEDLDDDEEEQPVKRGSAKRRPKRAAAVVEEDDDTDDEDDEDEDDEPTPRKKKGTKVSKRTAKGKASTNGKRTPPKREPRDYGVTGEQLADWREEGWTWQEIMDEVDAKSAIPLRKILHAYLAEQDEDESIDINDGDAIVAARDEEGLGWGQIAARANSTVAEAKKVYEENGGENVEGRAYKSKDGTVHFKLGSNAASDDDEDEDDVDEDEDDDEEDEEPQPRRGRGRSATATKSSPKKRAKPAAAPAASPRGRRKKK